jgi:formylmethanofuran dehydrogenase subunit B
MARKEVVICDLCGKVADKLDNQVTINKIEYKEVCTECAARLNELVKKIQNPPMSQYMKRKARLANEK